MKICVLTTETSHHCYFVQSLSEQGYEVTCVSEAPNRHPPRYDTLNDIETQRDSYEFKSWFKGKEIRLRDLVPTREVDDVNSVLHTPINQDLNRADVIFVFGTGILRKPLIDAYHAKLMNFHGGNPEEYRGLDSHLWAIYHRDFDNLRTCLHRIEPTLDSGAIFKQISLDLSQIKSPLEFRMLNTEACTKLAIDYVSTFQTSRLQLTPQLKAGRYYSYMPASLKVIAYNNLDRRLRGITS